MRGPTTRRTARVATALCLALLALAGCTATDTGLPAAFADGVPAPSGEVVLTLTVDGREVPWDIATLEQLDVVELTMYEPFVKEDRTFTGPTLRDVLVASGTDLTTATEVELVALDQFVAVIPLTEEALDGAVLATTDGGAPIAIADGGPIRLVFEAGNPTGRNRNTWIWSIVEGEVR